MSYSENDVLAKVGDLLVEINEEYATVQEQEGQLAVVQLGMLAAKAKYLAAHFELLAQLSVKQPEVTSDSAEAQATEEIIFTPATAKADEKEDSQQTVAEIAPDQEEPKAENAPETQPEPEPVEEEPVEEEIEEPQPEEEEPEVEEPEVAEEKEEEPAKEEERAPVAPEPEAPKVQSTERQPESEPSISAWRNVAEEKTAEEPAKEEAAVVNSVVEESRTIELNQPQKSEEAPAASSRPLTLNEMIQQQRRAGLTNANQFKTPATKTEQIVDLKTAVSLNDKLLFIKDLFNGYSLAYTEAIELLNRFDNMAEADAFLQANYSLKNNWASKPQTVEKLYHILQKKFA
ncbi:hypothetical protein [Sphingobacterium corticibacter]|uniref:Uncharacterized protein n=1 Tax=Sphingobacterium corticibacter TaxID=2171749 RepID=A0A2T8HM06_9SPHI|nr:hypothetical protein [Sphingobacterium corticibacter]PVH26420.1 hypothetical protein DC487_02030 [Sphingobacterium corticibacter]